MCTIRWITFGARLARSELSFPVLNRPQACCCFSPTRYEHTFNNYGLRRTDIPTRGPLWRECPTLYNHQSPTLWNVQFTGRSIYSTKAQAPPKDEEVDPQTLTLFQRYKKMLKEYWYVLIPVHMATSAVWFGSFFYASTCGIDIVPLLEYLGLSETWIKPFRSSSLGHLAVASALYKIATPARYAVTLGGTTLAIRVLTKRGLIKPMPSKAKMKQIVKQKRDDFIQRKTSRQ